MENGPGLKMYFLLKMEICQPAMLVYLRVGPVDSMKMVNCFSPTYQNLLTFSGMANISRLEMLGSTKFGNTTT